MNINLSAATAAKKKQSTKTILYGLNNRSDNARSSSKKPKRKSVFADGDSSSSDDENNNNKNDRKDVNRELAAEQAALRKRAQQSIAQSSSTQLYDYDGQFESFSSATKQANQEKFRKEQLASIDPTKKKESRYMKDILKHSKQRQQERDIAFERKVAKEQQVEEKENDELYRGKDKFVTKSYKRKLEEREAYLKEDKERTEREEREDVTKTKKAGAFGVAAFYGNLERNAENQKKKQKEHDELHTETTSKTTDKRSISMNPKSHSQTGPYYHKEKRSSRSVRHHQVQYDSSNEDDEDVLKEKEDLNRQAKQAQRIQKILSAREKYFARRQVILDKQELDRAGQ